MAMQHKLVLAMISLGSPFALWCVLYLTARFSAINMRRIVPWIRVLRRLASWATLALFLLVLAGLPSSYAYLSLGFSSGVILIYSWAIKRFDSDQLT
jgi:hypothetical protein